MSREIFEEFYDLSDAINYKIVQGISGIMVTGILPNIYFPRMDIANNWEGGLRITNTTLSLELFNKRNFPGSITCELLYHTVLYYIWIFYFYTIFAPPETAYYQSEKPIRGGHKLHPIFLRILNWTHI